MDPISITNLWTKGLLKSSFSTKIESNKHTVVVMRDYEYLDLLREKTQHSAAAVIEADRAIKGTPLEQQWMRSPSPSSPIPQNMLPPKYQQYGPTFRPSIPITQSPGSYMRDQWRAAKQGWNTIRPAADNPLTSPLKGLSSDLVPLYKLHAIIGFAGWRSKYIVDGGKAYVILTGTNGLRPVGFQGTKYLASNPKMIQLGLGARNFAGAAKAGAWVGFIFSAAIETLDFIFDDKATVHSLLGGLGVEAAKAIATGLIGYGAAALTGLFVVSAIAPGVVLVGVVFLTGLALNWADNHYHWKDKLITFLTYLDHDLVRPGLYKIEAGSKAWLAINKASTAQDAEETARFIQELQKDGSWLVPL